MNPQRLSKWTSIAGTSSGVLVVLLLAGCDDPAAPAPHTDSPVLRTVEIVQPIIWIDQFGTSADDVILGMAVHGDEVYVGGAAGSGLGGVGSGHAFLRKYGADGAEVWTRRFGGFVNDVVFGVAAFDGAVYVTGGTHIDLEGTNAGFEDAFVRRYDAGGNVVWTRQFGTSSIDRGVEIEADETGVYVVGNTRGGLGGPAAGGSDFFVRKFDPSGNTIWTRQFGTHLNDQAEAIAVGDGGIYVAGYTDGDLAAGNAGFRDAVVRKYDTSGSSLWTRQFGTAGDDEARDIAYEGALYVAGFTDGSLTGVSFGDSDGFLRRYDDSGVEVWTRQFGTPSLDRVSTVSADGSRIYLAGTTLGDLGGTHAGSSDLFFRAYDFGGAALWTRQLGTPSAESATASSADGTGIFVAGSTHGDLEGTNAGGADAYVIELAKSPADQLSDIESRVDDLASAGTLDEGERQSLEAKLDAARRHLEEGTAEAAINLLRAFINEVEALIRSGRLSEAEGQPLIDAAEALIASLGG